MAAGGLLNNVDLSGLTGGGASSSDLTNVDADSLLSGSSSSSGSSASSQSLLTNLSSAGLAEIYIVPLSLAALLPSSTVLARIFLFGVVCGFGVVANVLSVVVLVRARLVKGWTYAMVCNVSVSDLMVCLIALLLYLPGVVEGRFPFPDEVCYARMGMIYASAAASVFTYLVMALQRFVVIVLNRPQLPILQLRWLPALIVAIWICSCAAVCPLFFMGQPYAMYWPDNCITYSDEMDWFFQKVTMTVIYGFMVLSLVVYVTIYVVVKRSSAKAGGKKEMKNIKMAVVLFSLFAVFVLAYVPFCSFPLFRDAYSVKVQERVFIGVMFLAMGVSAVNPVIYALLLTPMRKAYMEMLGCSKKSTTTKVSVITTTTTTA